MPNVYFIIQDLHTNVFTINVFLRTVVFSSFTCGVDYNEEEEIHYAIN